MQTDKRIRITRILIYIFMITMLAILSKQYSSLPKGAKSLDIYINGGPAHESFDFYAGEKATLDYRITPEAFADRKMSWEIEDESIAFINGEGELLALNEGMTVLIAEAAGFTKHIKLNVKDPVVSIKGFKTDVTVDLGYSYKIKPKVKMAIEGIEKPEVSYESDNISIVTVNKKGKIKAVGYGTANITVKAGEKAKKIIVRVREPEIAPSVPEDAEKEDGEQNNQNSGAWAAPWFGWNNGDNSWP